MNNIEEMGDFIKMIDSKSLPSDYNKQSILSKLNSISSTKNLITDFEELKFEYEIMKSELDNLKSQNELLIKENQNLQNSTNTYSEDIENLKAKLIELDKASNNSNNNKSIEFNEYMNEVTLLQANLNKMRVQ